MAKNAAKLIDKELHALIGEMVVEFAQLEHELRCSTADLVCPAIGYPVNLSLFARVGFSELVDRYDFVVSYALGEAETAEKLKPENRNAIDTARQNLLKQLKSVNERRNRVVHSAYIEVEHEREEVPVEITLEALKPSLNRRALEPAETFNPFQNVHEDIARLVAEIRAAYHLPYAQYLTRRTWRERGRPFGDPENPALKQVE